jgi:hypothetical protein
MPDHHRPRRRNLRPGQPQVFQAPPPQASYPYPPANFGPSVSAQVLQDKNASVAKVTITKVTNLAKGPDYQIEVTGSAKREHGDRHDPVTGEMLALARALQSAARQLNSAAGARVTQAMEEQRAAEAAKAAAKEKAKTPPRKRTREEWEAILEKRSQEGAEQIARNLGLSRDQYLTREELRRLQEGAARVVPLSDGRLLLVEDHYATLEIPGREPIRFNLDPG